MKTIETAATAAVAARASKGFATVTTLMNPVKPTRKPEIVHSWVVSDVSPFRTHNAPMRVVRPTVVTMIVINALMLMSL